MKIIRNIFLLILALIICAGGIYIIIDYNIITNDDRTAKISNNVVSDETNETESENTLSEEVTKSSFNVISVESEDFENNYTVEEQMDLITEDYFVVKEDGDDVVITLVESEQNEELLDSTTTLEYDTNYIISNLSAEEVEEIFYGGEGQDLTYPVVYILLTDGTVKGINIKNGYETGEFVAETVTGLENIESIEQASVTPENDSGYEAVIAITSDESVYEIRLAQ